MKLLYTASKTMTAKRPKKNNSHYEASTHIYNKIIAAAVIQIVNTRENLLNTEVKKASSLFPF